MNTKKEPTVVVTFRCSTQLDYGYRLLADELNVTVSTVLMHALEFARHNNCVRHHTIPGQSSECNAVRVKRETRDWYKAYAAEMGVSPSSVYHATLACVFFEKMVDFKRYLLLPRHPLISVDGL